MSESERRHCRVCDDETLHDRITNIWGRRGRTRGLERAVMGLCSAGLSEAIAERKFVCQRCGEETPR